MQAYYLFIIFITGLIVGSFLNVVIFWLESNVEKDEGSEPVILGSKVTSETERLDSRCPPRIAKLVEAGGENDKGEDSSSSCAKGSTGKKARMTRKTLGGRSFCPSCKHQLGFFDLVPLFSWIFLRAKCRYCKKPISIQYPLVELGSGLLFALTYWFTAHSSQFIEFPPTTYSLSTYVTFLSLILLLTVNCLLLIIFVYDLKHKIIPDKVILPAILLALSYQLLAVGLGVFTFYFLLFTFISAFGVGGFFYFLAAVSDGKWMGGGDIKLAFFMGLFLGFPNILVGLFLGFILGAIVGLGLMALNKAKLQSEVPFGPFLITGTWIALFWGDKVVEWYMRAFL